MPQFKYTTPIDIRFADLDAYGHVNNALYLTYLEQARIRLFQEHFGAFLDSGLMFLVVRAECDYHLPIAMNDPLRVTVMADQVRHTSFVFSYRLHDGGDRLYADAKTTMVCYDPKRRRPVAIPPEMKALFSTAPGG